MNAETVKRRDLETRSRRTFGCVCGVVALSIFLGGCGTTFGLLDDEFESKIYAGVQVDALTIAGAGPGPCGNQNLLPFAVFDFPVSLGLDTLFLPGTLLYELLRPPSKPHPPRE